MGMRMNRDEFTDGPHCTCAICGLTFRRGYELTRKRAARPQYCSVTCQSASKERYALEKQAARVWSSVQVGDADACWEWKSHRDKRGYGKTNFNRRYSLAHRAVFQIVNGPIPNDISVCHSCDNPPCCNPAHLWLGTHQDNMRDAGRKGRAGGVRVFGERHSDAKITDADALAIFHSVEPGPILAARYGITKEAVNMIRRGVNWARVTGGRNV